MIRVVVDAYGGDNAPDEIIKGAADAVKMGDIEVVLTGDEAKIRERIEALGVSDKGLSIVHTTDVISMHDEPTSLLKEHRQSSMAKAFDILAAGEADAFVSAGSTGAIVVGGTLIVKRIKGIKRPAIATLIPSPKKPYLLMDCGANAECRPEMLQQFGIMASAYLAKVVGHDNPSIGLLNIGTEDSKGGTLQQEAYALLKKAPINFVGNIESREMPTGVCDGIITDGFTGNIALKLIEGTSKTLFGMIKEVLYKNIFNVLAAGILKKDLYALKNTMNSSKVGGALLLGASKPVVKAHGNSDAEAIKNAILIAKTFAEQDVVGAIQSGLEALSEDAS